MKKCSSLILLFTVLVGLHDAWSKPLQSAATIIKCTGKIPNKTACLTKASSYKIDTYRVDICKESPFPSYRSSADYAGGKCMTLFNGNGNLYRIRSGKSFKNNLPTIGREAIKPDTYNYLTMILVNRFRTSGQYTSGDITWRTAGKHSFLSPEQNLKTTIGKPVEFTVKLNNWRGNNDKDNDYCDNNGGTYSRCEMNYNGYELTGIGLDNDFIEANGGKVSYMFYIVKLASPITLKKDSKGNFDLTFKNDLEVYGNGSTILSISNAPFIFQANYTDN